MDPNGGRFVDEREAQAWMPRFEVGEVLKVKGEEFEVIAIRERELVLKPLSAEERQFKAFGVPSEELRDALLRSQTDPFRRSHRTFKRDPKRGRKL